MTAFDSTAYWEARYRGGGNSGAGSYGRLAAFKADFINAFVADNHVDGVLDLGCGDGHLQSLLHVPAYTGVDVSITALACCITRYPHRRFVPLPQLDASHAADLALSIDVIFHLIEDDVFARHVASAFDHARRFVLMYASNAERNWAAPHVRHRRFTDHVAATQPGWRLTAHVPNLYPYDPDRPDDTSFADFFVYARSGAACTVRVPAAA
ncbi:MAG TPA: methyltransferase domain-containing protein [Acetobacteraceae bacterium]|jgi:SAM-dependent methyltransferase